MSKRVSFTFALALCSLFIAGFSQRAHAQAMDEFMDIGPTKGPYYAHSENELRARKLMRGVANVTLSVAEIPNQAFQEAYKTSPVTGAVVGAGKGLYKGVKRFAVGFWEIATFYLPLKNNYRPYIEPEVVFMEYNH